ncbi:hypothetical protein [Deinococcus cavernae]
MKTATLFNHAGGAGKTSITLNAGYELARSGPASCSSIWIRRPT